MEATLMRKPKVKKKKSSKTSGSSGNEARPLDEDLDGDSSAGNKILDSFCDACENNKQNFDEKDPEVSETEARSNLESGDKNASVNIESKPDLLELKSVSQDVRFHPEPAAVSRERMVDIPRYPIADIKKEVFKEPALITGVKTMDSVKYPAIDIKKEFQNLYPDLKSVQLFEQMHEIVCGQTLFTTYVHQCKAQTAVSANKAYSDFVQEMHNFNKFPLFEVVEEYRKAKVSSNKLRKDIKYFDSNFRRRKDYLWKSVKKEVVGKGKCEDGNAVVVSHSYVIKELDQLEYEGLIRTLKDIVESISKNAFHTYVENLAKRRIESRLSTLVKTTAQEVSGCGTVSADELDCLKKSICVLFDCFRQNPPDHSFIETSREWLNYLVSVLLHSGSFSENLFLFNHVLRSPKGIHSWASNFIKVTLDDCQNSVHFDCDCPQKFLLLLFMLLNPVPFREAFLSNLKETESVDGNFAIIDSDGDEEEQCEFYQRWSDADVFSLLNQIPLRNLLHCWISNLSKDSDLLSENKMLKLFAYCTTVIDVLFTGISTYSAEEFMTLVNHLGNLITDILLLASKFWDFEEKLSSELKSVLQAVYDKFFFHVVYEFIRLKIWNVLPAMPFNFISNKMLWNVLWIFSNSKSEDGIFSEKDLERRIQDDSSFILLTHELKKETPQNILFILKTLEKLCLSVSSSEEFLKFIIKLIFELVFVDQDLRKEVSKEGCTILSSLITSKPHLISLLLKEINNNQKCAVHVIPVFQNCGLLTWVPSDADINYLSSWLLSDSLCEGKNCLARIILSHMNWNFTEEGSLFLPLPLHQKTALLVAEAYIKFDQSANEWLVSRGVKQMLQFTNVGGTQSSEEGFVCWAWNLLFSLKLHPLDQKHPPLIAIFDGSTDVSERNIFNTHSAQLLVDHKRKHPCISYLMIVMTDVGLNLKNLTKDGLNYLASLLESQQYMACIQALYYVLPFFVKNSEVLLKHNQFLQFVLELLTADLGFLANFTSAPVIGSVLLNLSSMIKFQVDEAVKCSVECAVPLLKLWIKLFLKILLSEQPTRYHPTKQAIFLLDVLVKVSYFHQYARDCTLELFHSINFLSNVSASNQSFLKWVFSSTPLCNPVLDEKTALDHPLLTWFIVSSEMNKKQVIEFWNRVQRSVAIEKKSTVLECLKKASEELKIEMLPLEYLPIYRWANQITALQPSNSACVLFWQQFFIYFFQRIQSPVSQPTSSLGLKYFNSKPYNKLMEQIKMHLKSSIRFYQDSLGLQNALLNNETFSTDILRLFCAFELWISDESLHKANLCLTALEPKYCPDHLKSILEGNSNPWFNLVPAILIKNELDQKVKSWNKMKTIEEETQVVECIINQESLPEPFLVENCQHASPNENHSLLKDFHSIDENILSSSKSLLRMIEANHSVIFEKASFFDKQMKKLRQLNDVYINLVPQEYTNVDETSNVQKFCHKGANCSGYASFKLKFQKYVKNERISLKIDNNRKEFMIIQNQLTNLPVNDLCDASILIENYISALSQKLHSLKDDELDQLKKVGATIFYNQLDATQKISPLVSEYPPSQLFFSSIIDSLGKEFIFGCDLELENLVIAILNCSQAGSLALNLFNPNVGSLICFRKTYKTLTEAVGKYSPSTLLALMSKVDLSTWLQNCCPPLEIRKDIFNSIGSALFICGCSPSEELFPLFVILKRHFRIILKYMFPDLFYEALAFLLSGLANQKLSKDIFYEAYSCFGCPLFNCNSTLEDIEVGLRNFALNQRLPASQQMFLSTNQLSAVHMTFASSSLYHYFIKNCNSGSLYKKFECYIKEIALLVGIVSHSVVALQLEGAFTEELLLRIWEDVQAPFRPFLHPIYHKNTVNFPWNDEEAEIARYMFQIFAFSFKFFHQQVSNSKFGSIVFSCLWNHYIHEYVEPGFRHFSFSLFHEEMLVLPWHQFYPTSQDIEGMCKITQSNLDESKNFLAKICLQIPWLFVMRSISSTRNPEYVARVLATLAKLLILSHLNSNEAENCDNNNSLKELEGLSWNLLSIEDVKELLILYYQKGKTVLFSQVSNNQNVDITWFLKMLCCMNPNINCGEAYANYKRVLYLEKFFSAYRAHISQIAKAKASTEISQKFPAILSEVNNVIGDGVAPEFQVNCAVPLVQEILNFLDNLPDKELSLQVVDMIISWLNSNVSSPLLLPYLKVSFSLHSISHAVSICECCIAARFSTEVLGSCNAKKVWDLIYSFFSLSPSLYYEFSEACIERSAFLTLYCHVKHGVMPQCGQIDQKRDLLADAVQWFRRANLKASEEAKVLLLLDAILELSCALISLDEIKFVRQELAALCCVLRTLAEDGGGFFSVIGLGTVSNLSINFRFLCRVVEAFLLNQFLENNAIRTNVSNCCQDSASSEKISSSVPALKALDNLKSLQKKKSYAALNSLIDHGIKCISESKYTIVDSRELLRYFAVILYPKESFLSTLNC